MLHHMKQPTNNQSGFTLVEIAIVLVIIGLLLGGVLKGQELIENAKVKNAVSDLKGITSAYYGYVDRFRRLPGDDGPIATLTGRGGLWANVGSAGNNSGVLINLQIAAFTGAAEGLAFWQHLRAAGLITGSPALAGVNALPRNAFNGLTGVVGSVPAITGMAGATAVCMSEIPGKAAAAIDTQMDDGLPQSGTMMATVGTAGANTPPLAPPAAGVVYIETNVYTLCLGL